MWFTVILSFGVDFRRTYKEMITYFEQFLGLEAGTIVSSDAGIVIAAAVGGVLIFGAFKVVQFWLENLFNRY